MRGGPERADRGEPYPAIAAFLGCSGLVAPGAAAWFERLPRGVSSDIGLVCAGGALLHRVV